MMARKVNTIKMGETYNVLGAQCLPGIKHNLSAIVNWIEAAPAEQRTPANLNTALSANPALNACMTYIRMTPEGDFLFSYCPKANGRRMSGQAVYDYPIRVNLDADPAKQPVVECLINHNAYQNGSNRGQRFGFRH